MTYGDAATAAASPENTAENLQEAGIVVRDDNADAQNDTDCGNSSDWYLVAPVCGTERWHRCEDLAIIDKC
ncbi:hypothetical protein HBH92_082980 [Parastagonospora nodorum]|nr:hypothetical protein HBH97_111940 [Parastagonospora nodorum]KAH4413997.1 hypothetical protein HBH92_082980 [Parastagonospora nodorum]KAH4437689.1 hypothetical protein HBH93_098510 [Parastagonospora nodorum]KAH4450580.1 hypothetical protein HBH91_117890 [Parastagonospora nodorum]KAH4544278.1 hypothetical protein HBH85_092620 [Parastagonospora nodorum]